jgi:hypothetical protein
MSKAKAYRQPDVQLLSVEKQAVEELVPASSEPVVSEPIVSTAPVVANVVAALKPTPKQPMYTLLVNDQLALVGESKVPTGSWYAVFVDLEHSKIHGPYPLLVKTSKGFTVLTGYLNIDNAKSVAHHLYDTYAKANWKEVHSPLYLADGQHKFMSTVLYVD